MNYRTPDHKRAVEDCNEALKLDKNYIKALNRRANSLEVLGQYEEALRGLLPTIYKTILNFIYIVS